MRLEDLPRYGLIHKPFNRKVYAFFWAPFQLCLDIFSGFIKSLPVAFLIAAMGWVFFVILFYFFSDLTNKLIFGVTVIAVLVGIGLAALAGVFKAIN